MRFVETKFVALVNEFAFGRFAVARECNVRFRAVQMLQTSRHGLLELKADQVVDVSG